jgi:hypothetical protein
MPIQIIDADYEQLKRAARAGRVRSKEVQQLVKAVQDLAPGKAKALVPERGENVARLRTRLSYAARAAGVKLRVAVDEDRVLFALRSGSKSGAGRVGATERRRLVQQKAFQLGKGGRRAVTAEDVLKALAADGVTFEVARPATMVGAVLRSMPEFERTGRNTFKYKG